MLSKTLSLLRATEDAAIAASKWVGTGDKLKADEAATDAMRSRLNSIADFAACVQIGEGIKDESFGLFSGEMVGKWANKEGIDPLDLALDPIDGTRPTVSSGPEALSVIAAAEKGKLFATDEFYMHKIAYGPYIAKKMELKITDPPRRIVELTSAVTGKDPSQLIVCFLDRPRHEDMIKEFRATGVRIKLIRDCDISGAIATALPESGIDIMYGIGGAPEAVIAACAMKCLGGGFQAQIAKEGGKVIEEKVFGIDDMVQGPCSFVATGITHGSLLRGVRFTSQGPVTNSVMMRSKSNTVRWITTYHGDDISLKQPEVVEE